MHLEAGDCRFYGGGPCAKRPASWVVGTVCDDVSARRLALVPHSVDPTTRAGGREGDPL